ncbi:MAG: hypothetical protein QXG00_03545 [Candidatus Woesearchaeota archaeon]
MVFSKSFPRITEKSNYPIWEEVYLSEEEELLEDERARHENIKLMKECIDDAKKIFAEKGLKDYQTDIISIAISLFEKRASHSIYHKENKAKQKFDQTINKKTNSK